VAMHGGRRSADTIRRDRWSASFRCPPCSRRAVSSVQTAVCISPPRATGLSPQELARSPLSGSFSSSRPTRRAFPCDRFGPDLCFARGTDALCDCRPHTRVAVCAADGSTSSGTGYCPFCSATVWVTSWPVQATFRFDQSVSTLQSRHVARCANAHLVFAMRERYHPAHGCVRVGRWRAPCLQQVFIFHEATSSQKESASARRRTRRSRADEDAALDVVGQAVAKIRTSDSREHRSGRPARSAMP